MSIVTEVQTYSLLAGQSVHAQCSLIGLGTTRVVANMQKLRMPIAGQVLPVV